MYSRHNFAALGTALAPKYQEILGVLALAEEGTNDQFSRARAAIFHSEILIGMELALNPDSINELITALLEDKRYNAQRIKEGLAAATTKQLPSTPKSKAAATAEILALL